MMNYLTMIPNYYCISPIQTPSYVPVISQNEIRPSPNLLLLNTISQALNLSLRNYQQNYNSTLSSCQIDSKQQVSTIQKVNNSKKVIEIIISEEEQGEILNTTKVNHHSNNITTKQPLMVQKNTNITLQLPTDDQNILQSKETSIKKDNDSKNKNRKSKTENKNDTFQVIVPETDPIQTAYLPSLHFPYDSLAKKKEELMNRRVGNWNDFVKYKKERREIRMLGS